ncbi:retrovirus-related pol polyprotein from transposon TNT 1-94 [Tanacetum coccineum]
MSASNQQTLAESGASERPLMLEKYVPWASRFMSFLENKQEEGERMRHSIEVGPYERKKIQNPDKPHDLMAKKIKPLSKMTESNKQRYFLDIKVTTLVNVMERNNIRPLSISINTKFLHSLQPDQYEPHVIASKANKAVRNHDPLALVAHLNIYSSHSHASPSYSHSSQPYYVTHPSSVIDYEEDYQGEIQRDAQEDNLKTAMMLLARAITQCYSTPTNNRLRTSLNTRNQAVLQDGRVDIQSKNVGYTRNGNKNARRSNRNQIATAGNGMKSNVQCYNCNVKGYYAHDCPQPKVRDAKYFREQMLLAMKDEAGGNLNEAENDFMLDN